MKNTSFTYLRHAVHKNLLVALLFVSSALLGADSIKVQVNAKSDHRDPKGSEQETHLRRLEINATAYRLEGSGEVQIEWFFFGDDLSADKIVKHASGVEKYEAVAGKVQNLVTKDVIFNFVPRHSVKSGSGRRVKYQMVEASGIRYHGWGVRVRRGGLLVTEDFSSPEIKKYMPASN